MSWLDPFLRIIRAGLELPLRTRLVIGDGLEATDDPATQSTILTAAASSGAGSIDALEMMAGVAGAAVMAPNTRFFFGCVVALPTVPFGPGLQWLRPGYADTGSPADTPVEAPVGVAGQVVKVEVLFLEPGIGTGIYSFDVTKNPLGAQAVYGGPFVPANATGIVSDSSHYSFAAGDTIGIQVVAREDIAGPIAGAPSKVWVAVTYQPD